MWLLINCYFGRPKISNYSLSKACSLKIECLTSSLTFNLEHRPIPITKWLFYYNNRFQVKLVRHTSFQSSITVILFLYMRYVANLATHCPEVEKGD